MDKIILIKSWEELGKLENDKYYIEIDRWSGWIKPKFEITDDEFFDHNFYLSTHTFYGGTYNQSTEILQKTGFNVQLANWDGETVYYKKPNYEKKTRRC